MKNVKKVNVFALAEFIVLIVFLFKSGALLGVPFSRLSVRVVRVRLPNDKSKLVPPLQRGRLLDYRIPKGTSQLANCDNKPKYKKLIN